MQRETLDTVKLLATKIDELLAKVASLEHRIDSLSTKRVNTSTKEKTKQKPKRSSNARRLVSIMRRANPELCTTLWWETTLVPDMTDEQKALVDSLVAENKVFVGKSGRLLVARALKSTEAKSTDV